MNCLKQFELEIAELFNAGAIPYPVHLESGNEEHLIRVFKDIDKENDYVFGSWRLHLKALLKGVTWHDLKSAIMNGHSMSLRFDEQRVYGSAIVGGSIPIALGAAMGIQRRQGTGKVWCFVGDMTSMTGIFSECLRYAENFNLPIRFVVEDNNLSVCTNTREVWGSAPPRSPLIEYYQYTSRWPHAGAGKRIQF